MAALRINERTRFSLRVSFLDGTSLAQPGTARWRAYCATTDTDLTDWAPLSVPASGVVQIDIPASLSRIINAANLTETKFIAVEADEGTEDQVSDEYEIQVKNLRKTG